MSAALKLTDLSKTFPVGKRLFGGAKAGVKAVQPLSLTVGQGETLGIVGFDHAQRAFPAFRLALGKQAEV